jgi:hypothetical protein
MGFHLLLEDTAQPQRTDSIGTLSCVGVATVAQASVAAHELINEGIELIELCGGFGAAGTAAVIAAAAGRVPVGAVFYGLDASAGLQRLFASVPEIRTATSP